MTVTPVVTPAPIGEQVTATLTGSAAARIPLTLSLAGGPASTQVTLVVTHPNGVVETLTGTTDSTGAGTLSIIPQGQGSLVATITQVVTVATLTTTVS